MSNKRFGCLGVVLVILLIFSFLLNLILIGSRETEMHSGLPRFEETTVAKGAAGTDQKVALISINGVISSSVQGSLGDTMVDDAKLALRQAAEDSDVKAIVLQIDSPGGEVTASDVIYRAVVEARAKKPVVVSMGALAASGGYYIACGGSYLFANDTTITGSIGVIIQTLNYEALFGKLGLNVLVFKSGKFKDMLSGAREMSPEEKEYVQSLVMQTYSKFLGIVSSERGLPIEPLRTGPADGRVISGQDALKLRLVDAIGYLEDAFAKARELGKAPDAAVVRYEAPMRLSKLFRWLGQSERAKVEINLGNAGLTPMESGKLYLLPSYYAP